MLYWSWQDSTGMATVHNFREIIYFFFQHPKLLHEIKNIKAFRSGGEN